MYYVLRSNGQVIGYFGDQTEGVMAMEEERRKKDGTELCLEKIEEEEEDGKTAAVRY